MESHLPLVSICIPTYNGEKYVQEALDSIKKQIYKNIEVIISDDNSSDRTLEICNKFKSEVGFPVHIHNHKPNGIGANWNNCIKNSNGEYIQFLFQDDKLSIDSISKKLSFIYENNLPCVFSKRYIIDESSQIINTGDWFSRFGDLQKNTISIRYNETIINKTILRKLKSYYITDNIFGEPGTFLFEKDLFEKNGYFNEKYKQVLDAEFYYRVLKKYPIGIIPEKLYYFRVHNAQASYQNQIDPRVAEEYNNFKKYIYKNFFFYLPLRYKISFIKSFFKP